MLTRRQLQQQQQAAANADDSETGVIDAWLTTGTAVQMPATAAEESIVAFRTITALQQQQEQLATAQKRNVPTAPQRSEPIKRRAPIAATSSSDDEDDDIGFEAIPKTPLFSPPPKKKVPTVIPSAAFPEPIVADKDTFIPTRQNIRDVQFTRRSDTRSALDALRKNQIPGYEDNVADVERDVVINRPIFKSFVEDSAREYQDANKPPWAPRLPADVIDKMRTWEKLEIFSELEQRQQPWYDLGRQVAGNLGLPLDSIAILGPSTASTQATRPSRSQTLDPPPISAGSTRDVGIAGVSDALAQMVGMTPARDTSFAPMVDQRGLDAGFERFRQRRARQQQQQQQQGGGLDIDEQGSFIGGPPPQIDNDFPAAPPLSPPPPQRQPGEMALDPQTDGQIDDTLLIATQNALAGTQLAKTGARFQDIRNADRKDPQWFEMGDSAQARVESQMRRAEGARGRAWIARPLATGVFYLNHIYTAARDNAHSQITGRAQHLKDVPMYFFGHRSESGTVQFRVFTQFARLIAELYRLSQHGNNRSAKLASDAANYAASIESITQFFMYNVTFDSQRGEFNDNDTPRGSKPFFRAAEMPTGVYTTCPSQNPLLVRRLPGKSVNMIESSLFAGVSGW